MRLKLRCSSSSLFPSAIIVFLLRSLGIVLNSGHVILKLFIRWMIRLYIFYGNRFLILVVGWDVPVDLFCLELLKGTISQWLQMHHIVEGCSLIWKSGLLFLESKQLNKLRRHPHYHSVYSIIKSMLWVYFKIESMTAVRLLTKDFNIAANPFSREILLYFPGRLHIRFFEYLNNICMPSLSFLYWLCLSNDFTH